MVEEFCVVCGERIVSLPNVKNQKYCSPACENKVRWERQRQRRAERKYTAYIEATRNNLDSCVAEAKRRGMSYGQYMAWRWER